MHEATSVYKYYDAHGILIYVGITKQGIERNRQHNSDKEWWQHVSKQEVEHLDSRDAALAREKRLIELFRPPFNKQHNSQHQVLRAAYLAGSAVAMESLDRKMIHTQVLRRQFKIDLVLRGEWFYTVPEDAHIALSITMPNPVPVSAKTGLVIGHLTRCEHASVFARMHYRPRKSIYESAITVATARIYMLAPKTDSAVMLRRVLTNSPIRKLDRKLVKQILDVQKDVA